MRVVAAGVAIVAVLVALAVASRGGYRRGQVADATVRRQDAPPAGPLPSVPPAELAAALDRAQAIIDDRSSSARQLASAGRFEQLATLELARRPVRDRRAILARVDRPAERSMSSDLEAADALARLVTPHPSLPRWRIAPPPAASVLLGYFKAAERQFGVPWQYLAAIEFIETKFGRVEGTSDAGAQGPMQFLPSTWARYGSGNIRNPRDAILAAARYLVASGAPGDIAGALYHYNPSTEYVAAVEAYAGLMRADHRAYYGYYYWQVIYARVGGLVILPQGYPKIRPTPVQY